MVWWNAHWLEVFAWWAALNALLDGVAQILPAGKFKTLLTAIGHLSPLSVISAMKAIGVAATPPVIGGALSWLLVIVVSCATTSTPAAADVAGYMAEQLACVDTGATRDAIDGCRGASRQRWCAKFPEAANCKRGGQ